MATVTNLTTYAKRIKRGVKPLSVFLSPEDIKDIKRLALEHDMTIGNFIVYMKNEELKREPVPQKPKRATKNS